MRCKKNYPSTKIINVTQVQQFDPVIPWLSPIRNSNKSFCVFIVQTVTQSAPFRVNFWRKVDSNTIPMDFLPAESQIASVQKAVPKKVKQAWNICVFEQIHSANHIAYKQKSVNLMQQLRPIRAALFWTRCSFWGAGRCRNRIWCILALKSGIWWQNF